MMKQMELFKYSQFSSGTDKTGCLLEPPKSTSMSSLSEIQSATLLCFPCPPLPLMSSRLATGETVASNSHDNLAMWMSMLLQKPETVHKKRQEVQIALENSYVEEIRNIFAKESDVSQDDFRDQLYNCMCTFTRGYIQSYNPDATMDVRFMPWADVPKQSAVHTATVDHYNALCVLEKRRKPELDHLSYMDIVTLFIRTFILT